MPNAGVPPDSIEDRATRPSPGFAVTWIAGDADAARLRVAGELDLATTSRLEAALGAGESDARLVALDLRDLGFIDVPGVRAIVHASLSAREGGRRLVLLRCPANIERLFTLTGTRHQVELGDIDRDGWPAAVAAAVAVSRPGRVRVPSGAHGGPDRAWSPS